MPTCISNSTPSLLVIPTACPVSNIISIFPSKGDATSPFSGMTAAPFPRIPCENVASFTCSSGMHSPWIGLRIRISFPSGRGAAAGWASSARIASSSSSSSTMSSKPISIVAINATMTVMTMVRAAIRRLAALSSSTYWTIVTIAGVAMPKHFIWKKPPKSPPATAPMQAPSIGLFSLSVTP